MRYWGRMLDMSLALWLAASPWVLEQSGNTFVVAHSFGTAALMLGISIGSFWVYKLNLANLVVALWLAIHGYFLADIYVVSQNHLCVGLSLLLLALVPTDAVAPPPKWEEYERQRGGYETG